MDEIARLTPTFTGVSYEKLDELGSIQWPCNDDAPEGTPVMHHDTFVRGKGKFLLTEYVPTEEKVNRKYPLILTTGRILSQYNVGAQTRRTANVEWHDEDRLEIHPHDAEERGIKEGDWVGVVSRAGETTLRARITERVQPGVVYTTFHHPESGANVITTENSDWATNCPEYKVTAVQVMPVFHSSEWQSRFKRVHRGAARAARRAPSGHERRAPGDAWRTRSAGTTRRTRTGTEALKSAATHVRRYWDPRMRHRAPAPHGHRERRGPRRLHGRGGADAPRGLDAGPDSTEPR